MIKSEMSINREMLLKAYFSTNCNYYLRAVLKFEAKGILVFNIWAGIFPIMWLVYRKMYKQAIILYFLIYIIDIIVYNLVKNFLIYIDSLNTVVFIIESLILFIPMAFFANYLYIKKSIKIVDSYISENNFLDKETVLKELREKGDVSYGGVVIYIIISTIISFVYYFLCWS